ncbi:hypothetical protein B0H11DRAFT_1921990 [Mycena galericulata]|nr:hypothetical protein B0H11DRAFT_1921990 [Mycena galericulata]
MSNSAQPAHTHTLSHPVPFAIQRRRTIIACKNCRKRKIRCIPPEQPPQNPCARCARRKLPCEYVSVIEQEEYSTTNNTSSELRREPGAHSAPRPPTTWTPPMAAHNTSPGNSNAPRLPYTSPPPPNRRPRYSSSAVPGLSEYPDLSLPHIYDLGDPTAHQYFSRGGQPPLLPQTAYYARGAYIPDPDYNPMFYGNPPGAMQGDQWTRESNPG